MSLLLHHFRIPDDCVVCGRRQVITCRFRYESNHHAPAFRTAEPTDSWRCRLMGRSRFIGMGTDRENTERNLGAILTATTFGLSLQLGGDDVLARLTIPGKVEHIRLATDLTVSYVTLPHPYGSIHHRLVPLSAASALKARGDQFGQSCSKSDSAPSRLKGRSFGAQQARVPADSGRPQARSDFMQQQRVSFQIFRPSLGANLRGHDRAHSRVPRKTDTHVLALFLRSTQGSLRRISRLDVAMSDLLHQ